MTESQNDNLVLRDARTEEMDDIAVLIRDAYLQYKSAFPPHRWQQYEENIMDVRSRLGAAELIVAELNGHLAGAVTLYTDGSQSSMEGWPAGWAGIRLLAVPPACRGKGIGRALMEECIRRCRKLKIKTIGLHTTEMMKVAREMYERMGFIRAPEYDFNPGPDTVVMAYRLELQAA